jgi:hypothetical protein
MDDKSPGGFSDGPSAMSLELENGQPLLGVVLSSSMRRDRLPRSAEDGQFASKKFGFGSGMIALAEKPNHRRSRGSKTGSGELIRSANHGGHRIDQGQEIFRSHASSLLR